MITPPSRKALATTFDHLRKGDVPVKAVNVSTASTVGTAQRMKDLQTEEIFDSRYAVDVYKLRSIQPSARSIAKCSIDRGKYLRIGVSMGMRAVRSMRAVFCPMLPRKILLRAAPNLLTSTMALQSHPKRR
jgi:hypothetical protein